MDSPTAIETLAAPINLPCGLTLPNRFVKCPMQETLAEAPVFDPPIPQFRNLYSQWARGRYGLIITGQVQVDSRYLSIAGDVCTHEHSLSEPHLSAWKEWAELSQLHGTPAIVQLAHPGRMSPVGAGNRPKDMPTLCPSSVSVTMGTSWLDKAAVNTLLGTPKAMTVEEIDEVVGMFVHGANVAIAAGFSGVQVHGAHGFLVSQFLSPHTNRRNDEYGGTPEKRMKLLRRLVEECRAVVPKPLCLSVKLNSADYMAAGEGLEMEEGLEQVRWLVDCGMVDFVEISGGNAETKTSGLHTSFNKELGGWAPQRTSTRLREAFFTEFAEKVQELKTDVPIQLSGGFRSRVGMADAIESGACQLIGLGRTAVLEPELPAATLLNPDIPDDKAFGIPHMVKGQWIVPWMPAKIIGAGLGIRFFYHNMRRLGNGLKTDPGISIPKIMWLSTLETFTSGILKLAQRILQTLPWGLREKVA
ncbi:nadh:flavin oxidoreductase nadh oxidase [Venturia nashicola]|uniref:Nadh:flavin oxidoreductase nadh oxidase n=1 Tax=Venturia nashicola TaxID=86259 RepID=A0A4Z1P5S0_9PEZI|nr:nadh:flavin oxidoreductase nadh oxidase [Venturia nashicola]TLD34957.1 nadh:flavin oxidoreductase nadh oxidase [Venturia nashicola]